ncbi:OrNVorf41-like-5 [Venturia canescens]|uniref:OrNVorf41-like-5 n=1 Tax=Venturia canescens TaxID=32260 RepID=A0ACB9ZIL8_9HYME|nr:uncharacterized LOC122408868 [Venturia canescens]KAI5630638.1 OrNVorf41-like-5 [Venturia canescens]
MSSSSGVSSEIPPDCNTRVKSFKLYGFIVIMMILAALILTIVTVVTVDTVEFDNAKEADRKTSMINGPSIGGAVLVIMACGIAIWQFQETAEITRLCMH